MLATLVPFFDKNKKVIAYFLHAQKNNFLLNPQYLGTGKNDGAGTILGLDVIQSINIHSIASDIKIMMRISEFNLYTDIEQSFHALPHNRIILVLDAKKIKESQHLARVKEIKEMGFCIALQRVSYMDPVQNKNLLALVDYFLLDASMISGMETYKTIANAFPHVSIWAYRVDSVEKFEQLKATGIISYFEGSFHRIPSMDGKKLKPVKTTCVELFNYVNTENYDLVKVSKIISKDPAITIDLLKTVDHMTINHGISSIQHAAAMLGQIELRHWINTVAVKNLCADRPSETLRVTLLRAKIMEQLATLLGNKDLAEEYFLTGIFSIMDVILDISMQEVFQMFHISEHIKNALLLDDEDDPLHVALCLLKAYEDADWTEVSRLLLLHDISDESMYQTYLHALDWYNQIITIE